LSLPRIKNLANLPIANLEKSVLVVKTNPPSPYEMVDWFNYFKNKLGCGYKGNMRLQQNMNNCGGKILSSRNKVMKKFSEQVKIILWEPISFQYFLLPSIVFMMFNLAGL
jgi:hypothetical protein